MEPRVWISLGLGVLVAFFIVSLFNTWSEVNCVHQFIDARTGRIRTTRHLVFLKVSDQIIESDFSKLWKQYFGEYPQPDWRLSSTLPGWGSGHSPNYAYTGAYIWQEQILAAFETAGFDEPLKRTIMSNYIARLSAADPFAPYKYSSDVLQWATEHYGDHFGLTNAPDSLLGNPTPSL